MKKLILLGALLAPVSLVCAQETPAQVAEPRAEKLATKTLWAEGFGEPQGLALEIRPPSAATSIPSPPPNFSILVADYKRGEIVRLSMDGKTREVVAKDLKSPAQIATIGENIFVTERKANRVIQIDRSGSITQIGGNIEEPLGLIGENLLLLRVVSHTTSKLYGLGFAKTMSFSGKGDFLADLKNHPDMIAWYPRHEAPTTEGAKYGYRCLAQDGQTLFLTDEDAGAVLMISPNGFVSKFADGIPDPSGLVINDGALFVCDESNGGRLWQIGKNGDKKIVADGLGRPRGIVFIASKVALVSDRNGKIWRVELP